MVRSIRQSDERYPVSLTRRGARCLVSRLPFPT